MKAIALLLIACLLTVSANSSDWEIVEVDKNDNIYTVNSMKIKTIKTMLPSVGKVISGWVRVSYSDKGNGISSELNEYYIKCRDEQFLHNSHYSYNSDGKVVQSKVNLVRNVDLATFHPILPDSSGEVWFSEICKFSELK